MRHLIPLLTLSLTISFAAISGFAESKQDKSMQKEIDSVFFDIDQSIKKENRRKAIRKKQYRKKMAKTKQRPKRRAKKKKITEVSFTGKNRSALPEKTETVTFKNYAVSDRAQAVKMEQTEFSSYEEDKPKKYGINVFGFYSGASNLDSTNYSADYYSVNQPNGSFGSSQSYGLGAEHSMELYNVGPLGLGYQVGATYEFERTFETEDLNYNYTAYESNDPKLSLILPYANATASYKFGYLFGGVNYSVPQVVNAGGETFEGLLGYQAGLGANIGNWVSVELLYRWVHFDVLADESNYSLLNSFNASEDNGFGLYTDETMSLYGLNFNIKIRF